MVPYEEEELRELRHQLIDQVETLRVEARRLWQEARDKEAEDERYLPKPVPYKPGDYVWVYDKKDESNHSTMRKFRARWTFGQVVEALTSGTYRIKEVETGKPYAKGNKVSHWRLRHAGVKKAWHSYGDQPPEDHPDGPGATEC
jgi:hypothetical protein